MKHSWAGSQTLVAEIGCPPSYSLRLFGDTSVKIVFALAVWCLLCVTAMAEITVLPTESGKGAVVARSATPGRWLVARAVPFKLLSDFESGTFVSGGAEQSILMFEGSPGVYGIVLVPTDTTQPFELAEVTIGTPVPPPDPLTVTVNQAADQPDPASSGPIRFAAVFARAVADFAAADVSVGGTAGAKTAAVTGSGTTYTVAVDGMSTDGTVTVSIPAGVATDSTGRKNAASTSIDNTVTYQKGSPGKRIVSIVYDSEAGLPLAPNDKGLQLVQAYVTAKHGDLAYRECTTTTVEPNGYQPDWLRAYLMAMREANVPPPALIVTDGTTIWTEPLPQTGAAVIDAVNKYGG